MTDIIVTFIQSLQGLDWKSIFSLVILGMLLILVNSITHYVQQRISERRSALKKSSQVVEDNIVPLMKNTDNLIARLTNMACGFVEFSEFQKTIDLLQNTIDYNERLKNFDSHKPTWSELTALRFLQFAWAVQHFRRGVAQVVNNNVIDDVEYFISDKIPMVLRGKLYGCNFISRDLFDESLAFFPAKELSSIEGPTILDLFKLLKADDFNRRRVFRNLVEFFTITFRFPDNIAKLDADEADKYSVLCQFGIYLIDLFQNMQWTSKWEEYRIFLVRVVREWNSQKGDFIYLYYAKDVDSDNYIDTFSEDVIMRYAIGRFVLRWHLRPFSFPHRCLKRMAVFLRCHKYMHRYHRKLITPKGITVSGDSRHDMYLSFPLAAMHSSLNAYLHATRRRKAIKSS